MKLYIKDISVKRDDPAELSWIVDSREEYMNILISNNVVQDYQFFTDGHLLLGAAANSEGNAIRVWLRKGNTFAAIDMERIQALVLEEMIN